MVLFPVPLAPTMMQKFGIGLPTAEKLQEMARRDLEKNV